MDQLFETAKSTKPPAVAYQYEQPGLRLQVSLCRELQRNCGDGPFYLACRTAGRLLSVHYKTA